MKAFLIIWAICFTILALLDLSSKKEDCKETKVELGALRECAALRNCKVDADDYVEAVKNMVDTCPPPPLPKPKTTST